MKTVLVIDDDDALRAHLAACLTQEGWAVWEASDGEAGVNLARERHPQAIVCDLLTPRSNGFQVCKHLRADPAFKRIPIIAVSGKDFPANRQNALDSGANEFLAKPLSPRRLVELLEQLTGNNYPEANAAPAKRTEAVTVKFWGVRGSIPVPGAGTVQYGGNTSCIEVRVGNEIIILDAGTGIRPLGLELMAEFRDEPISVTILISHTHWDHIQGFPFFQPAYEPRNHIRILGYEGAREGLAGILSSQMESPYFPIGLRELPGHIVIQELKDLKFGIGEVGVEAAFMNHPGICVGYRLNTSQGSIAYLPDNEPLYRPQSPRDTTRFFKAGEQAFAQAEDAKMIEFLRGADVLIIDAQYDAEEYRSHIGWGHGCVDDVLRLAARAGAKRLFLFHHDPNHDDARITRMVEDAREWGRQHEVSLEIEAAREGEVLKLRASPRPAPGERVG